MRFTRRHLRNAASLILGMWLFALFVGIANACLPGQALDGHPAVHDGMAMAAHHSDDGAPADCIKFCNDDVPLFAKLQLVQDQPAAQAFLVFEPVSTEPVVLGAVVSPTQLAHPPPDVPVYLRSLRLAL